MKKAIYTILAAIMIAGSQLYAADEQKQEKVGWFKKTFMALTWDEAVQVVKSPKEIARRIKTRVDYKSESIDTQKTGKQTWYDRNGDCEDFAACVVDLCRKKGFEAWIEVFFEENNSNAHAVAMGRYKGKLWISSNGSYQTVKSTKEARRVLARDMGWNRNRVFSDSMNSLSQSDLMIASTESDLLKIVKTQ